MRRHSVETSPRMGRLLQGVKPASARRTMRSLRNYVCGSYDPDWIVEDALRIVQLNRAIVVRDTIHETFPMQHGKYHENFTLRKILLTFVGLIMLGIMTGFLLFTPAVLLSDLAADGDPTITVHYVSSNEWTIRASLSAHVKLENQSLLPMQIPTCAAHVMETCHDGSGAINGGDVIPTAASLLTKRSMQEKKIPIDHRDFDWGTSGRTQGTGTEAALAAEVSPVTGSRSAPIAVIVNGLSIDSERARPEWHANNSALGPDGFYGTFELRTPDNLERASFPICYATPLSLSPVHLMPRARTELQLVCLVDLDGGSRPEPLPPPFSCEGVPEITELSTATIKDLSRSKVYRASGGGRVKTVGSELPFAAETRVEDLAEACAKYGHVWLQFQLLQGWVWVMGSGGTLLTQQTTAPVAIPCSVL